jgi:hypothetical protein
MFASALLCFALSAMFAFAGSSPALGATPKCSRDMKQLLLNIKRPSAATRGLTRSTVVRSLGACSSPAQWRVQANHFHIAAALAPLLDAKNLETDRTLDRLCTVFDAYNSTNVCKHHLTS